MLPLAQLLLLLLQLLPELLTLLDVALGSALVCLLQLGLMQHLKVLQVLFVL